MRWKTCFASDYLISSKPCLSGNPLIFNASTRRMTTTYASAVIWENRPTCSWLPLTHSIAIYHSKANEKKSTHNHLSRRRRTEAPPGTAPVEEKPVSQCVGVLSCRNCGETWAIGGSHMKAITIRLPDVEAAMLVAVQKKNWRFKDIQMLLRQLIQDKSILLEPWQHTVGFIF